jgi:hypothetical protein
MSGSASIVASLKAIHPYVEATIEMNCADFNGGATTVRFQLAGQDDIIHHFNVANNATNTVQLGPPAFADQSSDLLPWDVTWYNSMNIVPGRSNTMFICHLRVMFTRCRCGCATHAYISTVESKNGADAGYAVLLTPCESAAS